MAILNGLLFVVFTVCVLLVFTKLMRLLWQIHGWLNSESLRGTTPSIIIRIFGVMAGLLFSFFALFFAFIWVSLGRATSGTHWNLLQWAWTLISASLPFLLASGIVYVGLCTSDVKAWRVLRWDVSPRALGLTMLAEFCIGFLVFLQLKHAGYI